MNELEDTKDVLAQFLGQTYGELHKIDNYITSPSQHVQRKSGEFKNVIANILTNEISKQPATGVFVNGDRQVPLEVRAAAPVVQVPVTDPNQMEFTFDDITTIKGMSKALVRIEDKLDRLTTKLNQVLDSKRK